MRKFGNVWDRLDTSGDVREQVRFGNGWKIVENIDKFGNVWKTMNKFGKFGQVWKTSVLGPRKM